MASLTITPVYTQGGPSTENSDSLFGRYALFATLAFTVVVFLFESYLNLRQRSSYCKTEFPIELKTTVSSIDEEEKKSNGAKKDDGATKPENSTDAKLDKSQPLLPQLEAKFSKAQSYGLDKISFSTISSTYSVIEEFVFVLYGFYPYMWDASCSLGSKYFGWDETADEIKITLIFLALLTVVGTITQLPFELYGTFCIEKKHGFNKQTPKLFIEDKLKNLVLTAVIGGPCIAAVLKLIKWGGDKFYIYVWTFTFFFSTIMMTIVPEFIMPLFNKYDPLPEGELKKEIYSLAGRLKFPLTKLFVMDGSKRSSHSNAFMFGFFNNKRIVLFDTLLEQVHDDEILAILGHELGHWKMGHTAKNFVITQLYTGAIFYCFSLCYNSHDLYRAFGFNDDSRPIPIMIALVLFTSTLWAPVDRVLGFIMTLHSRKCEYEADEFAVNLGMSRKLQSGLCKIHLENLGAMCPDHLYSTYHYSHPPLVERLSAMMKLDKKSK